MRTLAAVAIALVACGPAERDDGSGGGGGSGSGSGSGSGNGDGCSDAAKLVYVVDSDNRFSRFDPMTKTFTDLGTLSCPAGAFASPFSMGVDRNTIGWVLYSSGELFRVDITAANLPCTKASWATQQGLLLFGMGFSTDMPGGTSDTLFVAGSMDPMSTTTSKLATLSTQTFMANVVGNVAGTPELTGTGNAELWGWFPSASAPRIEQINKASGAPVRTFQATLSPLAGNPMAWAFAFWGGDFWVFLEKELETSTTVYQIDGMTGQVESTTPATGREIVGAGVSTCAPVVIL